MPRRENDDKPADLAQMEHSVQLNWFKATTLPKFHATTKLKYLTGCTCKCLKSRRDVKLYRVLHESNQKVEEMLDVKTMIQN